MCFSNAVAPKKKKKRFFPSRDKLGFREIEWGKSRELKLRKAAKLVLFFQLR